MDDDTTVLVVDLNPSLLPFIKPSLAHTLDCPCSAPACKLVATMLAALVSVALLYVIPLAMASYREGAISTHDAPPLSALLLQLANHANQSAAARATARVDAEHGSLLGP